MCAAAKREIEAARADGVQPGTDWTRTAELVGPAMPPDAADVVRRAVNKMTRRRGRAG